MPPRRPESQRRGRRRQRRHDGPSGGPRRPDAAPLQLPAAAAHEQEQVRAGHPAVQVGHQRRGRTAGEYDTLTTTLKLQKNPRYTCSM